MSSSPPDAGPETPVAETAPPAAAPVVVPEAPPAAAPARDPLLGLPGRPTFRFFGVVASLSLAADIGTKSWAELTLSQRTLLDPSITLVKNHLFFTLAYNRGGAWGLLQDAPEAVRKPFFLAVSVLAIAFIVSLYSRLLPGQWALKWGLPLVLGGALGNLSDRITRSSVIDFIDYRADWVATMNGWVARAVSKWTVTDHWPTFNVADIAICVGVGLMAIDMMTAKKLAPEPTAPPPAPTGDPAA